MKLLHLADCNDSLPPGTALALAGIKEADFLAFIFSEIIPLSSSTCTPLLLHRSLAAASHSSYNILQHICKSIALFFLRYLIAQLQATRDSLIWSSVHHQLDFIISLSYITSAMDDSSKPNRTEFQSIRIEKTIGDSKAAAECTRQPCCLIEQEHSRKALDLSDAPIEKVVLVVGEYLPGRLPSFNHKDLPKNPDDFKQRKHRYLATRGRTALIFRMINDDRTIYRLLECKDGLWTAGPLSAEINEHIFFYREFVRGVTDTQKTYRFIKYGINTQVETVRVFNTYTRNRINGSNNKNYTNGANDQNYTSDPNFTNGSNDESHTDDSSDSAQAPISRVEPNIVMQEQGNTDNLLLTRAAEDVCALLRTANHSARNHPVPQKSIGIFEKLFRRQIVDEGAKAVAEQCVALWNHAVERAKEILASQGVRHDRTMGRVADMIKTGREGSTTLRETLAGHSDKCEDSDESD
ncbi:unnamed protein product [Fusarium graminearum]|uniref:Uncharacterized protein n=2 Tax=Gibberella zeae TaxID=5518 RepID=A0A4E9E8M8_GIBZA|nr:unnamed protein product [Fusarium graminearum]